MRWRQALGTLVLLGAAFVAGSSYARRDASPTPHVIAPTPAPTSIVLQPSAPASVDTSGLRDEVRAAVREEMARANVTAAEPRFVPTPATLAADERGRMLLATIKSTERITAADALQMRDLEKTMGPEALDEVVHGIAVAVNRGEVRLDPDVHGL